MPLTLFRSPFSFSASNLSLNVILVLPAITLLVLYLYSEHIAQDAGLRAVPKSLRDELKDRIQTESPSVWGMPARFGQPSRPSDSEVIHEKILVLLTHDVSLIRYLAEGPPASLQATVIDINELSEPRHDLADDSCPFSWLWMFGETSNTASTSNIEQIVTRGLVSRACVNLLTVSTAAPTSSAWTTTTTTDVRVFTAPLSPSDTHRVLTALYDGDELSTGSNRSPQAIAGEHVREVGLMSMLGPAANPYEYWPDHRPSRWNRKVVRYFTETGGVVDKLKSSWATTKSPSFLSAPRQSILPWNRSKTALQRLFALSRGRDARLARQMRSQAGVCVSSAWKQGQPDVILAQAMLSGCIVAAIPPSTHANALANLVLALPSDDAPLSDSIPRRLAQTNADTLNRLALRAFDHARRHFTFDRLIADVQALVDDWRDGHRGVNLPHGLDLSCKASSNEDSGSLPWCIPKSGNPQLG